MPSATGADPNPTSSRTREETILEVLAELQRLVRDARAGFKAVAGEHGLTYYQGSALVLIYRRGGVLNMSEISDALHMSPSTVTSIVDALLGRGLVERGPAIDDRRSVVATLTDSGNDIAQSITATQNQAFADRFDAVPTEEIGPFLDVLTALSGSSASSD
jgi:DNA-binding MarR family transcriptional regulator